MISVNIRPLSLNCYFVKKKKKEKHSCDEIRKHISEMHCSFYSETFSQYARSFFFSKTLRIVIVYNNVGKFLSQLNSNACLKTEVSFLPFYWLLASNDENVQRTPLPFIFVCYLKFNKTANKNRTFNFVELL